MACCPGNRFGNLTRLQLRVTIHVHKYLGILHGQQSFQSVQEHGRLADDFQRRQRVRPPLHIVHGVVRLLFGLLARHSGDQDRGGQAELGPARRGRWTGGIGPRGTSQSCGK